MLQCNQIFTNTSEVTMQVIRAMWKAILHKLPLYNEYMCSCWVSTLHVFGMICCLFSNCNENSATRLRSPYITFYPCCKCAMFLCAHTPRNAMRHSIEICLLYRQRKHLWKVFSFKSDPLQNKLKIQFQCVATITDAISIVHYNKCIHGAFETQ